MCPKSVACIKTMFQFRQKKAPVLVVSQTAQTNIPPKEPVLYSKETQTPVLANQKDDGKCCISTRKYKIQENYKPFKKYSYIIISVCIWDSTHK